MRHCLKISLLFAFSPLVWGQFSSGKDVAIAETTLGKVRGFIHNGIYTYKGIPYAQAKRFEEAQPLEAWGGVKNALVWGPVCPVGGDGRSKQETVSLFFKVYAGNESEDCLVLNIWTPSLKSSKKRPVMVYFHGGGFSRGSSQQLDSFDGENLAKSGDVVVVTVNHRLNVLGFLNLSEYGEKYKYSANQGILDLRKALEWVNLNIGNFGGDKNNVLIFGQSGGGGKVNALMAMPSAQHLFHKAVVQSGAGRNQTRHQSKTAPMAKELLKVLDIPESDVDKIQTVGYDKLAQASRGAGYRGWGPSIDDDLIPNQIIGEETFTMAKDKPLLIGSLKTENTPSYHNNFSDDNPSKIKNYIAERYGDKAQNYIEAVKQAYPNANRPTDLVDIDQGYRSRTLYQADIKSGIPGSAPVYVYLMTWESPLMNGVLKSYHCMELPFVFNNSDLAYNMTGGTDEARKFAETISKAWVNFAYYGNPNCEGLPNWEPYTKENGATMLLDNNSELKYHHDSALLEFFH